MPGRCGVQRRIGSVPGGEREKKEERDKQQHDTEKHIQGTASRGGQNDATRLHGVDAPALGVAPESAASEPKKRTKSPRAVSIIRGGEGKSGQKGEGGTLVWTPFQLSVVS